MKERRHFTLTESAAAKLDLLKKELKRDGSFLVNEAIEGLFLATPCPNAAPVKRTRAPRGKGA